MARLEPPAVLFRWRDRAASDARRSERIAALLGMALGVSFTVCFVTGLYSHVQQHPPSWFTPFPRPAWLYRVTQGVHIATGIAAIPLLLAKLWAVYPKLFAWPPFRSVGEAVERATVFVLVTGSVFQLVSGTQNIYLWYPWRFFFPSAHYAMAWVVIGALIVHIGAKLPITRRALARVRPTTHAGSDVERRSFLRFVGVSVASVTALTVGQTLYPFRKLSLLAPREPGVGPQGLPVNRTAAAAAVRNAAPDVYRLKVNRPGQPSVAFTLEQLVALPQHTATIAIACVEGWSASATWTGVSLRTLLDHVGVARGRDVDVQSLQSQGRYARSSLSGSVADDRDTLLALQVNGEPLVADHGAPVRLIAPNRPGVLQTKWVGELSVR